MKKLNKVLFGFGSVAAVVAPVAAVVACGDNNEGTRKTTIKNAADFVTFAKDKGYAVTEVIAKEIVAKIGVNAEITSVLQGKLHDEYHGADDYALVIKGTKPQAKVNIASAAALTPAYSLLDNANKASVANIEDSAATSLTQRWGLTEDNAKEATAIIYLQNNGQSFEVEYVEVKKTTDNKIVTDNSTNKPWTIAKA